MSFDGMLVFDDTELDFDVDAEVLCTQESDDVTATVEYGSSVSLDEGQDEERDDDESSTENVEEDLRMITIRRLEGLALDFLEQLLNAMPSTNNFGQKHTSGAKIAVGLVDRKKAPRPDGSIPKRFIIFPQRTKHASSKPLAQLLRVVELMHEALVTGIPTTKRDMYYKDVQLFGSQAVVDRLVDDVAATIGVRRSDLNVRAASKGLILGRGITMHLQSGEVVVVNPSESTLIPPSEEIQRFEVDGDLSWVLVVEKEAIFQTLCRLELAEHPFLPGPGVILTGKGYPDLATRQLVCTLAENLPPTIPIVALVDCDPYGMDILSVYKYGSTSMLHEHESLAAPRLMWVGVKSEELHGLGISKDSLIPITSHDWKKALAMLRQRELPKKWKKELQHMLHSRRKAEIEVLSLLDWRVQDSTDASNHMTVDEYVADAHLNNGLLNYVLDKLNRAIEKSEKP